MAGFYLIAGLIVMIMNFNLIPGALATIFTFAFTGEAAVGGAIGAAIRFGVARGLFSNEVGLGSAPIAAAAARTDLPRRQAFGEFLGGAGPIVVAIGLIFFATSTIFGWAYYGEKCFHYLSPSPKVLIYYRFVFIAVIFVGATATLDAVWLFSDVMNGLMAIPNLIGLLGLSGVIVFETKRFNAKLKEEREAAKRGRSPVQFDSPGE
jgi:AGCS family alanine or glycine:cation symporter